MYYEIAGDGPPVVLIGGLSQDHVGWMFQVPALVSAGYRVITPDNRDAGQTAQSPSAYGIRDMADDTAGLMDALGISSAHIVGLSMGGMIAQEMAIGHPARVSSLTLVCTFAAMDPNTQGILRAWRAARPHCDDVDFTLMLSSWLFTHRFFQQPEAVRQFLELVSGNPFPQSATGFQRQCDAVMAHDARDRLSKIKAPTQIVVGAEDNLTPPHLSRDLAARITNARVAEVPKAAHVLSIEAPESFNGVLLEFLAAQRSAAAV
jgi:pimeloyl-ACP methyl ester carboxylesterase